MTLKKNFRLGLKSLFYSGFLETGLLKKKAWQAIFSSQKSSKRKRKIFFSATSLSKSTQPLTRVSSFKKTKTLDMTNSSFFPTSLVEQQLKSGPEEKLQPLSEQRRGAAAKFFNRSFDKNRLKALISWSIISFGEKKTIDLVEKLKTVGYSYATKAAISLSIDDLKIPEAKKKYLYDAEQILEFTNQEVKKGYLTEVEFFSKVIETWNKTSDLLKDEVINNFKTTDELNPVFLMAFSGARGNISQVRQLVSMRGLMSDPQGQIINFPIQSNFREGLTLTEYVISCYGARKGVVDTALRTATSGYLTRRLVDVAQHVIVRRFNCETERGIFLTDLKKGEKILLSLKNRILGRRLAEDVFNSKNELIAIKNQDITNDLAILISKNRQTVLVRSPLTCKEKGSICQLCYGWSLANQRLVSLGEAVGVIAAQSIGEPGTQLTMRTFHTGGIFSGELSGKVIKADFKGKVFFSQSIPGKLIRSTYGQIVFLTKQEGFLFLTPEWLTLDFSIKTSSFQAKGQLKKAFFLNLFKWQQLPLLLSFCGNFPFACKKPILALPFQGKVKERKAASQNKQKWTATLSYPAGVDSVFVRKTFLGNQIQDLTFYTLCKKHLNKSLSQHSVLFSQSSKANEPRESGEVADFELQKNNFNVFFKLKFASFSFCFTKKANKLFETKISAFLLPRWRKFKIPAYSLLFVKQNQWVEKAQILAEAASFLTEKNQSIETYQTIYSELSGEIFFQKTKRFQAIKTKLGILENLTKITKPKELKKKTEANKKIQLLKNRKTSIFNPNLTVEIGEFWILSAQRQTFFNPINLLVKPGDFIHEKSISSLSKSINSKETFFDLGLNSKSKKSSKEKQGNSRFPLNMSAKILFYDFGQAFDTKVINQPGFFNWNLVTDKSCFRKGFSYLLKESWDSDNVSQCSRKVNRNTSSLIIAEQPHKFLPLLGDKIKVEAEPLPDQTRGLLLSLPKATTTTAQEKKAAVPFLPMGDSSFLNSEKMKTVQHQSVFIPLVKTQTGGFGLQEKAYMTFESVLKISDFFLFSQFRTSYPSLSSPKIEKGVGAISREFNDQIFAEFKIKNLNFYYFNALSRVNKVAMKTNLFNLILRKKKVKNWKTKSYLFKKKGGTNKDRVISNLRPCPSLRSGLAFRFCQQLNAVGKGLKGKESAFFSFDQVLASKNKPASLISRDNQKARKSCDTILNQGSYSVIPTFTSRKAKVEIKKAPFFEIQTFSIATPLIFCCKVNLSNPITPGTPEQSFSQASELGEKVTSGPCFEPLPFASSPYKTEQTREDTRSFDLPLKKGKTVKNSPISQKLKTHPALALPIGKVEKTLPFNFAFCSADNKLGLRQINNHAFCLTPVFPVLSKEKILGIPKYKDWSYGEKLKKTLNKESLFLKNVNLPPLLQRLKVEKSSLKVHDFILKSEFERLIPTQKKWIWFHQNQKFFKSSNPSDLEVSTPSKRGTFLTPLYLSNLEKLRVNSKHGQKDWVTTKIKSKKENQPVFEGWSLLQKIPFDIGNSTKKAAFDKVAHLETYVSSKKPKILAKGKKRNSFNSNVKAFRKISSLKLKKVSKLTKKSLINPIEISNCSLVNFTFGLTRKMKWYPFSLKLSNSYSYLWALTDFFGKFWDNPSQVTPKQLIPLAYRISCWEEDRLFFPLPIRKDTVKKRDLSTAKRSSQNREEPLSTFSAGKKKVVQRRKGGNIFRNLKLGQKPLSRKLPLLSPSSRQLACGLQIKNADRLHPTVRLINKSEIFLSIYNYQIFQKYQKISSKLCLLSQKKTSRVTGNLLSSFTILDSLLKSAHFFNFNLKSKKNLLNKISRNLNTLNKATVSPFVFGSWKPKDKKNLNLVLDPFALPLPVQEKTLSIVKAWAQTVENADFSTLMKNSKKFNFTLRKKKQLGFQIKSLNGFLHPFVLVNQIKSKPKNSFPFRVLKKQKFANLLPPFFQLRDQVTTKTLVVGGLASAVALPLADAKRFPLPIGKYTVKKRSLRTAKCGRQSRGERKLVSCAATTVKAPQKFQKGVNLYFGLSLDFGFSLFEKIGWSNKSQLWPRQIGESGVKNSNFVYRQSMGKKVIKIKPLFILSSILPEKVNAYKSSTLLPFANLIRNRLLKNITYSNVLIQSYLCLCPSRPWGFCLLPLAVGKDPSKGSVMSLSTTLSIVKAWGPTQSFYPLSQSRLRNSVFGFCSLPAFESSRKLWAMIKFTRKPVKVQRSQYLNFADFKNQLFITKWLSPIASLNKDTIYVNSVCKKDPKGEEESFFFYPKIQKDFELIKGTLQKKSFHYFLIIHLLKYPKIFRKESSLNALLSSAHLSDLTNVKEESLVTGHRRSSFSTNLIGRKILSVSQVNHRANVAYRQSLSSKAFKRGTKRSSGVDLQLYPNGQASVETLSGTGQWVKGNKDKKTLNTHASNYLLTIHPGWVFSILNANHFLHKHTCLHFPGNTVVNDIAFDNFVTLTRFLPLCFQNSAVAKQPLETNVDFWLKTLKIVDYDLVKHSLFARMGPAQVQKEFPVDFFYLNKKQRASALSIDSISDFSVPSSWFFLKLIEPKFNDNKKVSLLSLFKKRFHLTINSLFYSKLNKKSKKQKKPFVINPFLNSKLKMERILTFSDFMTDSFSINSAFLNSNLFTFEKQSKGKKVSLKQKKTHFLDSYWNQAQYNETIKNDFLLNKIFILKSYLIYPFRRLSLCAGKIHQNLEPLPIRKDTVKNRSCVPIKDWLEARFKKADLSNSGVAVKRNNKKVVNNYCRFYYFKALEVPVFLKKARFNRDFDEKKQGILKSLFDFELEDLKNRSFERQYNSCPTLSENSCQKKKKNFLFSIPSLLAFGPHFENPLEKVRLPLLNNSLFTFNLNTRFKPKLCIINGSSSLQSREINPLAAFGVDLERKKEKTQISEFKMKTRTETKSKGSLLLDASLVYSGDPALVSHSDFYVSKKSPFHFVTNGSQSFFFAQKSNQYLSKPEKQYKKRITEVLDKTTSVKKRKSTTARWFKNLPSMDGSFVYAKPFCKPKANLKAAFIITFAPFFEKLKRFSPLLEQRGGVDQKSHDTVSTDKTNYSIVKQVKNQSFLHFKNGALHQQSLRYKGLLCDSFEEKEFLSLSEKVKTKTSIRSQVFFRSQYIAVNLKKRVFQTLPLVKAKNLPLSVVKAKVASLRLKKKKQKIAQFMKLKTNVLFDVNWTFFESISAKQNQNFLSMAPIQRPLSNVIYHSEFQSSFCKDLNLNVQGKSNVIRAILQTKKRSNTSDQELILGKNSSSAKKTHEKSKSLPDFAPGRGDGPKMRNPLFKDSDLLLSQNQSVKTKPMLSGRPKIEKNAFSKFEQPKQKKSFYFSQKFPISQKSEFFLLNFSFYFYKKKKGGFKLLLPNVKTLNLHFSRPAIFVSKDQGAGNKKREKETKVSKKKTNVKRIRLNSFWHLRSPLYYYSSKILFQPQIFSVFGSSPGFDWGNKEKISRKAQKHGSEESKNKGIKKRNVFTPQYLTMTGGYGPFIKRKNASLTCDFSFCASFVAKLPLSILKGYSDIGLRGSKRTLWPLHLKKEVISSLQKSNAKPKGSVIEKIYKMDFKRYFRLKANLRLAYLFSPAFITRGKRVNPFSFSSLLLPFSYKKLKTSCSTSSFSIKGVTPQPNKYLPVSLAKANIYQQLNAVGKDERDSILAFEETKLQSKTLCFFNHNRPIFIFQLHLNFKSTFFDQSSWVAPIAEKDTFLTFSNNQALKKVLFQENFKTTSETLLFFRPKSTKPSKVASMVEKSLTLTNVKAKSPTADVKEPGVIDFGQSLLKGEVLFATESSPFKIKDLLFYKKGSSEIHFLTSLDLVTFVIKKEKVNNQNQTLLPNNSLDKNKGVIQKFKSNFYLGELIRYGNTFIPGVGFNKPGQIIIIQRDKVVLRYAKPYLLSSGGICDLEHGDFVNNKAPLFTLKYKSLKTEDIVQGIPKIEQLFEARAQAGGELGVSTLLKTQFQLYKESYPRAEAVQKSLEFIQHYIIDGIQNVYQSQGVNISDKHIEIIVKQMTCKVKMVEPNQSGFLKGDIVSLDSIELINKETDGIKAQYEPMVLGITKAALEMKGFISAASFQETIKILTKATILQKCDFLKGLKENVILGNLLSTGTGEQTIPKKDLKKVKDSFLNLKSIKLLKKIEAP